MASPEFRDVKKTWRFKTKQMSSSKLKKFTSLFDHSFWVNGGMMVGLVGVGSSDPSLNPTINISP